MFWLVNAGPIKDWLVISAWPWWPPPRRLISTSCSWSRTCMNDKKFLLRIYEAPIFSQEPEVPSLAAVILAVQFSSSPALWRYFVSAADITTTCNAIWKKELIKIQDAQAHQLRHDLSPRCRGQQVWPHSGASPGRSRLHNNWTLCSLKKVFPNGTASRLSLQPSRYSLGSLRRLSAISQYRTGQRSAWRTFITYI